MNTENAAKSGKATVNAARFFDGTRARRLFDEVSGPDAALAPRLTLGVIIAQVIAACIHLTTILIFIGGLVLLFTAWPNWLGVLLGGALALAGWFLLPRFGRMPKHTVTREQTPALHALTDEVAAALGTRPIDVIALDPNVNASYSRVGMRRTSVLTLGLPLWRILEPQERVALVAHELAHQENGDIARSFLIGHAVHTLHAWHAFLTQEPAIEQNIAELLMQWALNFVAILIEGVIMLMMRLFWSESQRAEYLADYLGSRVSGTSAFLSTNDRLLHVSAYPEALFDATMKTPARDPQYGAIFDRFAVLLAEVSPGRVEAARARADHHHEDGTHPPTAFRSAFLANRPCPPIVTLDTAGSDRIDAELAPFRDRVGQVLVRQWGNFFD